ncbi:MAG TPA: SURF1 family protein [Gemmatimonadales bacterium]|nr:SURF1 family protein [Gemmatimonadales bacterium]
MSPRARAQLFFAITVILALVFVRLGLWQVSRLRERRAANRAALAAREAAPAVLGDSTRPTNARTLGDHRIMIEGEYDFGGELVLRGQSAGGVPGVRVVTPLRPLGGDTAILVQRGFVPAPDAQTVDLAPLREEGIVRVTAIGFLLPDTAVSGEPREKDGRTTWRRIDLAAVRRQLGYPVSQLLALQLPDPGLPAVPRRDPPATLDDGPHLSYAVQWFSFALTAVVIGSIVLVQGLRSKVPGGKGKV